LSYGRVQQYYTPSTQTGQISFPLPHATSPNLITITVRFLDNLPFPLYNYAHVTMGKLFASGIEFKRQGFAMMQIRIILRFFHSQGSVKYERQPPTLHH